MLGLMLPHSVNDVTRERDTERHVERPQQHPAFGAEAKLAVAKPIHVSPELHLDEVVARVGLADFTPVSLPNPIEARPQDVRL